MHFNEFMAYSLGINVERATHIGMNSSRFLDSFLLLLSISLNFCMCVDLILMLRYPLVPPKTQMKAYFGLSFVYSSVYAGFSTYAHGANDLHRSINIYTKPNMSYIRFFVNWIMFVIAFIASVAYAGKKLCKKGISADVRKKILSRHVAYMVFFLLSSVYPMLNSMLSLKFFWHKYE